MSNLVRVSKGIKGLLDESPEFFHKNLLKLEGAELKKQLSEYLITVQQQFEKFRTGVFVIAVDAKYNELEAIFKRYITHCQKYAATYHVDLPSHREDSWGLLYSLRSQYKSQLVDRVIFNRDCEAYWGIRQNSYGLIHVEIPKVAGLSSVKAPARIPHPLFVMSEIYYYKLDPILAKEYNTIIVGEFVEKFLECIAENFY
jgi:hypothetical protein